MSEWLKEMRCKRIGSAYAGSNPAPPTHGDVEAVRLRGGGEPHPSLTSPCMNAQQQVQPGDPITAASEVARYFREDCRPLRDSLQLEMVAAQYWLRMRDAVSREGVPVGEAIGAGVVAALERHGDPLSHAILR